MSNGPVIKLEKIKTLGPYVRAMLYGKTDNIVVGTQPFGIVQK